MPTPKPKTGEVLVQVLAAGVNNTEINTRLGWYSKAVKVATSEEAGKASLERGFCVVQRYGFRFKLFYKQYCFPLDPIYIVCFNLGQVELFLKIHIYVYIYISLGQAELVF